MLKAPRIFYPWLWHGITAILILLFFLGTRHFPLVATPGFEAANLFVLIFAPWFALIATLNVRLPQVRTYLQSFFQQLFLASLNVALYTLLLIANSFEQQSCSVGAGFAPFFIILLPPLFLAIAVGTLVASLFYRVSLRLLFLLLLYAAYFSWVIYSWWLNPGFRVLTHASLLMSSDLLAGGELTIPIIGFRTATFLLALAIALGGIFFLTRYPFRSARSLKTSSSIVLIITIFLLAFILHRGSLLMVGKNREQLLSDYSLALSKDGINVKANPNVLSHADVLAMLDEALLFKKRIERRLGPVSDQNITIFLHKDEADKFDYTGAKNVHFANPKHREIHISGKEIPHPVLGHELAHIYVGEYANTIWGAPGSFGIFPNLALTEGLAMALTPELSVDGDLSLNEQARALFQAGLGTDFEALFSDNPLQFISNNVRSSYLFSGAFLQFILRKLSNEQRTIALQKIIHEGSIDAIFDNPEKIKASFSEFKEQLNEPIEAWAVVWAKNNFTPHSILATDCRDRYAKEKESFSHFLLNHQSNEAMEAISNLPRAIQADLLFLAVRRSLKQSDYEQALILSNAAEQLMIQEDDKRVHTLLLDQASLYFQQNDAQKAAETLLRIDEHFLAPPNKRRFLLLSELVLSPSPSELEDLIKSTNLIFIDMSPQNEGAHLHLAYLIGKSTHPSSPAQLLAHYLYARMLMHTHRYQEGLTVMKNLKKNLKGLPEAIVDENDVMLAYTLSALQQYDEAKYAYEQILSKSLRMSEQVAIEDALERILFRQSSYK